MRTVEGPGWKMIHGDCLDVLAAMPDKSVHVTLTDPPYEVEAHTEGMRQMTGSRGIAENPLTFAAIDSVDRFTAAAQFARVTTNRVLAFCQAEAIAPWRDALDAAGIPYRRAIPWCKPDAMPSLHGRWPGQAWEAIVLAQHRRRRRVRSAASLGFTSSCAATTGRRRTFTRRRSHSD